MDPTSPKGTPTPSESVEVRFFYKNTLYKNIEAEIMAEKQQVYCLEQQKFKNIPSLKRKSTILIKQNECIAKRYYR